MKNWKQIRKQIRTARSEVSKKYAQQASYKFSELIGQLDWYRSSQRVAGFLPFDGEADPLPVMDRATQDGKQVFVPIIVAQGQPLKFALWNRDSPTRMNQFGIAEPDVAADCLVDPQSLDFVITPLVAFDDQCNRLGVGGGFYDRSFAWLNSQSSKERSARLVGIAYQMQMIEKAPCEEWDVRLDAVVTETGLRMATE